MILEIIIASSLSFILGCAVIYLANTEDKHRLLHKDMEISELKKEIEDKDKRIDSLIEVQGNFKIKLRNMRIYCNLTKYPIGMGTDG